jgi:hypothetical protein
MTGRQPDKALKANCQLGGEKSWCGKLSGNLLFLLVFLLL